MRQVCLLLLLPFLLLAEVKPTTVIQGSSRSWFGLKALRFRRQAIAW
ncbi:MAG: hypothetical protein KDK65_02280 [Chlamydiia bacterium]|nr:hypothetical protein [Chlamydiia bacterium]